MSSLPEKQDPPEGKPKSLLSLDFLKLSALGGGVLYGILFLGYYTYYRQLDLHPEDLGVSYSYILVRSIGFIVLMGGIFGAILIFYKALSSFEAGPITRSDVSNWVTCALTGAFLVSYVALISPPNWPFWAAYVIIASVVLVVLVGLWVTGKSRAQGPVILALLALLLTLIVPTAAVITRANDLARQVLAGHPIGPYELLGVPILDVSAQSADVTWIGPASQRPAIFGLKSPETTHGLLLGEGAGTVILLVNNGRERAILRIPSSLVMVEGG
jgi:hypothetical protein